MKPEFAICVSAGPEEYLEVRKAYRLLPDSTAEDVDCFRVIDDSGGDYLYPSDRFIKIDWPREVPERLLEAPSQ